MPVSTPNGYLDFTNATPRATKVIATSNVGIGTVIPKFNLDVHGTANVGTLTTTTATFSENVYAPNLPLATIGSNLVTWNDSTGVFQDSGGLFSNKLAVVSEQPPSALAGASTTITNHGVYNVTASTGSPENAFDKSGVTSWTASSDYGGGGGTGVYVPGTARLHASTEQGDWIALEFPYKTTLRHLTFTGNTEKANLYATNDDTTWTELKNWESGETTVVVDASGSYKKYGLVTTKTTGSATLSLTELRFFTESFAIDEGVVNTSGPTFVGGNALMVPNGTTDERPSTAAPGMFRYNSTTDYFETYTTSGWTSIATPPGIVSISPSSIAYANVTTEVITVDGSSFDSESSVRLEGADGTLYDTTNFTFVNNATIRFTIGTLVSGQSANRPYKIVVTNGAGLTSKSAVTLGFEGPTWSSPASGSTQEFSTAQSTTLTLSATDATGGSSVSYSLVSGSLPGGLTLSGNTISGTSTESDGTTSTVTIRATDTADASAYTDLTFTIESIERLYTFTSHTFTNAGATGRIGPTLSQLRGVYTPSWTDDTNYLNVVDTGIQEWTVPRTGTYEIEAVGASGANQSNGIGQGGKGARMIGRFTLNINTIVKIAIGQMGRGGPSVNRTNPGGGGGTFVWVNGPPNDPLIIAGGGGGVKPNATYTNSHGQSGTNAGAAAGNRTSLPGQTVGVGEGSWATGTNYSCSGGGAGWLSQGNDGSAGGSGVYGVYGSYFKVGSTDCGGAGLYGRDLRLSLGLVTNEKLYGGFGSCKSTDENAHTGGFGGGGGGGCDGEGGGGGYTGGGATYGSATHGGGAGSFNGGTQQSNTTGYRTGDGYCVITLIS
jgi:hypothetical protein